MSDSNRVQLAYQKETSYGVLPTSAWNLARWTGESLKQETTTTQSEEVSADRRVKDILRTNAQGAGGFNFELSAEAHDDLFEYALFSAGWSSATTVGPLITISSAVSSGGLQVISDSANGFAAISVGQWVKISGFVDTTVNGVFKVTASAAGSFTIVNAAGGAEAAGASITVVEGAQIVDGTTLSSVAFEKDYQDLTNIYAQYLGYVLNAMTLSVRFDSKITGSFGFLGKKGQSAASAVTGGYAGLTSAQLSNPIMTAIDNVLNCYEGQAAAMAAMDIREVTFALNNNNRARQIVGTLGPKSIGTGSIGLSGTLVKYFESNALLDKYMNFTESGIAVVCSEASGGKALVFEAPGVKYTDADRLAEGKDGDVLARMTWESKENTSEDVQFRIARFA